MTELFHDIIYCSLHTLFVPDVDKSCNTAILGTDRELSTIIGSILCGLLIEVCENHAFRATLGKCESGFAADAAAWEGLGYQTHFDLRHS